MLFFLSLAVCVSLAIVRGDDFEANKRNTNAAARAAPVLSKSASADINGIDDGNAKLGDLETEEDDLEKVLDALDAKGGSIDSDSPDNEEADATEPAESAGSADSDTADSDGGDSRDGAAEQSKRSRSADSGSEDNDNEDKDNADKGSADKDDGHHTVYVQLSHKSAAAPKIHVHIRHQMGGAKALEEKLGVWVEPLSEKQIERAREITDLAASVPDRESGRCQQYIAQKDALRVKINVLTNKIQALRIQMEDGGASAILPTNSPAYKPQGDISVSAGNPATDNIGPKGKKTQTPTWAPTAPEKRDATASPTEGVAPTSKQDVTPQSESERESEDNEGGYQMYWALLLLPCLFLVALVVIYFNSSRNEADVKSPAAVVSEHSEERFENPPVRQWNDGTASRAFSISGTMDADREPVPAVGGSTERSYAPSSDFGTAQLGAGGSLSSAPSKNTRPYKLQFSFEDENAQKPKTSKKGRGGKSTY